MDLSFHGRQVCSFHRGCAAGLPARSRGDGMATFRVASCDVRVFHHHGCPWGGEGAGRLSAQKGLRWCGYDGHVGRCGIRCITLLAIMITG